MPQLELTVTERIDPQRAERLATELRRHLDIAGPYRLARRSDDPSAIPQYIQLIGDAATWLVLLVPAKWFLKSYLETLGPLAAHVTRDAIVALLKKDEAKPLADVATALADAREAGSGRVEIVVGLDIPDRHFGTAMVVTANSAEVAHALAEFVARVSELSAIMKAEVEAGRTPMGQAVITLEKDGGLTVRWLAKDFVEHEKRMP